MFLNFLFLRCKARRTIILQLMGKLVRQSRNKLMNLHLQNHPLPQSHIFSLSASSHSLLSHFPFSFKVSVLRDHHRRGLSVTIMVMVQLMCVTSPPPLASMHSISSATTKMFLDLRTLLKFFRRRIIIQRRYVIRISFIVNCV